MGEPVTWLMSIRNGMPFLRETLQSIAAQTYRDHSMLVWNDSSNDGTLEELQSWIPSRIPGKIITGACFTLGANLSLLVAEAQTELCARIDADDVNAPSRLDRQVAYMLAHPEVVALGTQVKLIDSEGKPIDGTWLCPCTDAETRWRTRWQCSLVHPSVMFRRSTVLRAGNYPHIQTAEDFELWIRLAPFGEIYSLPDELLLYRRHRDSMTANDSFSERGILARDYAPKDLFPGLTDEQALRLWRLTCRFELELPGGVSVCDLFQHARAARLLARRCGKPDDYFQKTQTYKDQRYWLRRNLLRRSGLARVADLRHRLHTQRKRWRNPERAAG